MGLKLGFIKPKTIFGLKYKKFKHVCPKEKLWNHRDFPTPIWPSPPHGKATKWRPPLTATACKFPAPARALVLLVVLLVARYNCWVCSARDNCWGYSACCYPRGLRSLLLRVASGLQRVLAGSMCCWPLRLRRAPLVAAEIFVLRFLWSVIRGYSPMIYKFPTLILAYKISITVK